MSRTSTHRIGSSGSGGARPGNNSSSGVAPGGVGSGVGGAPISSRGGTGSAAAAPDAETRQERSAKRRRSRGAEVGDREAHAGDSCQLQPTERDVGAAAAAAAAAAAPEPMDEEKGGSPAGPAADEVSAGEGLAEHGDGGQPAQRFGGGGGSEETNGGGNSQGVVQLLTGAVFSEEEGDYAADSERSTDHESMYLYGGGGRESDEQDMYENKVYRLKLGGGGAGSGIGGVEGRRGRGRYTTLGDMYHSGRLRVYPRASSPEAGLEGDDENSSSRNSNAGGGSSRSRVSPPMLKRRKVSPPNSDGKGKDASMGGDLRVMGEDGEYSESAVHSEGSGVGGGAGGQEEEEEAERDEGDTAQARAGGGRGGLSGGLGATAEKLEWKAKLGRQPIFMSRGLPKDDPDLLSQSESGDHSAGIMGGIGALSRPPQDPEDDRDRASSCSSADSPNPKTSSRTAGGVIVRSGMRRVISGNLGGDKMRVGQSDTATIFSQAVAVAGSARAAVIIPPPPNSPGGAVLWHGTSMYEANDPTEDRHVDLAHDELGVRIYCVCDGHGGSRAAQFVCENLAGEVLSRVVALAGAVRERDGRVSEGWTGNEAEVRQSLVSAFSSCDERFIAQLDPKKNRGYINAGCCVALVLLIRSKLYVAHVGDCRVVLGTTDAARFPPDLLYPSTTTEAAAAAATTEPGAVTATATGPASIIFSDAGGQDGSSATRRNSGKKITAGKRELEAVALSRDHNCDNENEVELVMARSSDKHAIRVSRNDEWKGARAIKRVAGSLAVTRAVGDAYLKEAVFSFSPYKARTRTQNRLLFFLFLIFVSLCIQIVPQQNIRNGITAVVFLFSLETVSVRYFRAQFEPYCCRTTRMYRMNWYVESVEESVFSYCWS